VHEDDYGSILDVNEYHVLEPIGEGSFASVYLCTRRGDDSGTRYAVKIFEKSRLKRRRAFGGGAGGGAKSFDTSSAWDKVAEEVH